MSWIRRNWWRLSIALLVVFLVASLAAPFMSADRFGDQIRSALETSLGRPVQTGKARFQLFTGAGFSVSEVVIGEDPQFGGEPFAWVETLEAYPEIWSLFTGKLRFSQIRMSAPIVNMVKIETQDGGRWNFERLLANKRIAGLPEISVRRGRVNFKFGLNKSVFYLTNADIDLGAPHSDADDWRVEFSGEPARTDRVIVGGAGNGLGTFRGTGFWRRYQTDELKLDMVLDRSPLGDLIALIYGRDIGIHGVVSANVSAKGPLADLDFNGRVRFQQMHRWDQMPMWEFGIPVRFRGKLNLPAQTLELQSESEAKEALPLALNYRVANYLTRPDWRIDVTWTRVPAAPLVPVARHLGIPIPEQIQVDGMLEGTVGYANAGGLEGKCRFREASVRLPRSPALRFADAEIALDDKAVTLQPATVRVGEGEAVDGTVRLEGVWGWRTGSVDLSLISNGARLGKVAFNELTLPDPLPISDGVWFGGLRYRRTGDDPGSWTGSIGIRDARVPIAGLAEPLRISSADLRLQSTRWTAERVRAEAGGMILRGNMRVDAPTGAIRFQIEVPEANGSSLEALLAPSLSRGSFLRRTLGIGRVAVPQWLADRKATGVIQIGLLKLGPIMLEDVSSPVTWQGTEIRLTALGARVAEGAISAEVSVDMRGADPRYRVLFAADRVEMNGASYSLDGSLLTLGLGRALLTNLRSDGTFTGRSLESTAIMGMETVTGCYRAEWQSRAPMLRFTELQATVGAESYIGRGATQSDGKLALQLTSGSRQLRLTGSLPALRVEP